MKLNYMNLDSLKISVFITTLMWSIVSIAKVEVLLAEQTYIYDSNPRLVDVLKPIATKHDWYWSSAVIFKFETTNITPIRDLAIKHLALLGQQDKTRKSDYQNIIQQLKSWQLATRLLSNLNYDAARIRLDNNPAFEAGKYFISLSTRPKYIHVNGAITKPFRLNFEENSCVDDYLEEISMLDIASKDFVYIIQPNGDINSVGIAYWNKPYWNKQCAMVMPGSQIYVPLAESQILAETATLNESIIKLMSNRILNQ